MFVDTKFFPFIHKQTTIGSSHNVLAFLYTVGGDHFLQFNLLDMVFLFLSQGLNITSPQTCNFCSNTEEHQCILLCSHKIKKDASTVSYKTSK